ncbi:FHA domain-containing protein [Streptomyces sp. MS06]|uniref:FHA domain-containing protein n=1 Tax=Streptomyces sp. MS06 TaxID=3385974 RepID=UPI0039A05663
MTASFEFPTHPARPSDAERDRALKVLRDGVAAGRLSHDTFVRRMELALAARRADQLAALTADLGREGRFTRTLVGAVEAASGLTERLRRAWRVERLPKLLLPHPGTGQQPLRIGRDPVNGLRLSHESVSRVHAELHRQGDRWVLRDLGSTNGTTVNGRRVLGAAAVRPGDQVGFGSVAFRLAAD